MKYLIVFALSALVLTGQQAKDAGFDETAFRKAVQDGLPPDPKGGAMFNSCLSYAFRVPRATLKFKCSGLESCLSLEPDRKRLSSVLLSGISGMNATAGLMSGSASRHSTAPCSTRFSRFSGLNRITI